MGAVRRSNAPTLTKKDIPMNMIWCWVGQRNLLSSHIESISILLIPSIDLYHLYCFSLSAFQPATNFSLYVQIRNQEVINSNQLSSLTLRSWVYKRSESDIMVWSVVKSGQLVCVVRRVWCCRQVAITLTSVLLRRGLLFIVCLTLDQN